MKPKTLVLMLVAIGCGLVAAFLTSQLAARKSDDQYDNPPVAKVELKQGTRLTADMFAPGKFLKGTVPAGAITEISGANGLEGKVLIATLAPGQVCTKRDLGDNATLLQKLDPKQVAISIPVKMDTVVAGFALPDSRVNLICTYNNAKGQTVSRTFLQDVKVLAVNTETVRNPESSSIVNPANVTVAVDPKEAVVIEWAKRAGPISLALRRHDNPDDPKRAIPAVTDIMGTAGADDGGPAASETVKVVVAKEDIGVDQEIKAGEGAKFFEVKSFAPGTAPPGAFDDVSKLEGKKFVKQLGKGTAVTMFYLTAGSTPVIETTDDSHTLVIYNGATRSTMNFTGKKQVPTAQPDELPKIDKDPKDPKDPKDTKKGSDAP